MKVEHYIAAYKVQLKEVPIGIIGPGEHQPGDIGKIQSNYSLSLGSQNILIFHFRQTGQPTIAVEYHKQKVGNYL